TVRESPAIIGQYLSRTANAAPAMLADGKGCFTAARSSNRTSGSGVLPHRPRPKRRRRSLVMLRAVQVRYDAEGLRSSRCVRTFMPVPAHKEIAVSAEEPFPAHRIQSRDLVCRSNLEPIPSPAT